MAETRMLKLYKFARRMTKHPRLETLLATQPSRIIHGDFFTLERLFQDPPFQIERAYIEPHKVIARHRHPCGDTFEWLISGDGFLKINDTIYPFAEKGPLNRLVPISRLDWHGGETGDLPSVFLSIQIWDYVPMPAVTEDWEPWVENEPIAHEISP